ncbi:MAG: cardiolipin synthase [Alistipes sp.]|nr:cardiolipin synthase [Alistipes sp.]
MTGFITYLLLACYTLSIVGVILVIISENRNPLKSMPWLIVLVLTPVLGLLLYFFFGQNLSKRRNITRRMRRKIDSYIASTNQIEHPEVVEYLRPLERLLIESGHAIPLYGSRFEIFADGASKMEALLDAIEKAEHHIHLQYYIIDNDETGRRLRDALVRKAKSGIEVRLLYDDVGSRSLGKEFFAPMIEAGIEVHEFLHVQFPRFTSKVNYRNHRKVVVIDGRIGFFGGMNIADRYVKGNRLGAWRDTHFRVEGGIVGGLQMSFLNDWHATTNQQQCFTERYYRVENCPTQNVVQLLSGGPLGQWRTLQQAAGLAISRAKRRIWIETPYYLPSEPLNNALQTAALAGIDVRLMLPLRSDAPLVDLAVHSYLDDMLKAGVKVLFYTGGFLHSKLMLIDDELAVVGSANLDFRSFEHNFEINGFVYDRDFVAQLAALYQQDEQLCHTVTAGEWFRRSRIRRMAESTMRLFSPLL